MDKEALRQLVGEPMSQALASSEDRAEALA